MEAWGLERRIGGRCIFANAGLSIGEKEIVFLVGRSGAGKSLMMRLVAQLDPCFTGGVSHRALGNKTSVTAEKWRSSIHYVSQDRITFPCSPRDTIETIADFNEQRSRGIVAEEVAVEVQRIAEKVNLNPRLLDSQWKQLSGGESQRMWLAISIAMKPKVLLLDEPTSACDSESTRLIEQLIVSLQIPTLWISHDPGQPSRVGGRFMEFPPQRAGESVGAVTESDEHGTRAQHGAPGVHTSLLLGLVAVSFLAEPVHSAANVTYDAVVKVAQRSLGASPDIGWMAVFLVLLPVFLLAYITSRRRLGIAETLVIGAIRSSVQVTILGFMLKYFFQMNSWVLMLLYVFATVLLAGFEVVGRPTYSYSGIYWDALIAVTVNLIVVMCWTFFVVLKSAWSAPVILPVLGTLMGNMLSCYALMSEQLLTAMMEDSGQIEKLLSFGATVFEATRGIFGRSLKKSLIGPLYQAKVAGLISIPPIMTGQILAGQDASMSGKYQVVLLVLSVLGGTLGSLLFGAIVLYRSFDTQRCLRRDKFTSESSNGSFFGIAVGFVRRLFDGSQER